MRVEYRVITSNEETSKQMQLGFEIQDPDSFMLDIRGSSGAQFLDIDFALDGNIVTWDGLALDGLVTEGDRVRLVYQ